MIIGREGINKNKIAARAKKAEPTGTFLERSEWVTLERREWVNNTGETPETARAKRLRGCLPKGRRRMIAD